MQYTEVMALSGVGGRWLYSLLLVEDLSVLGLSKIPITNAALRINSCVREGASSIVWSATYKPPGETEKDVVVKSLSREY